MPLEKHSDLSEDVPAAVSHPALRAPLHRGPSSGNVVPLREQDS